MINQRPHRFSQQTACLFLLTVLILIGCGNTTSYSRERAQLAADRLAVYQDTQQKRINSLATAYQQTEQKLLQEHLAEMERSILEDRRLDHQRVVDALVADWQTTTLFGNIRDEFYNSMTRQINRIEEGPKSVETAREEYVSSLTKLSV
ncbi:MAG: hypothetical protein AAGA25_06725, partial [Planctomycetota bacterium]